MTTGTIIVLAIIIAVVIGVIIFMVMQKKHGKGSCSCCGDCQKCKFKKKDV